MAIETLIQSTTNELPTQLVVGDQKQSYVEISIKEFQKEPSEDSSPVAKPKIRRILDEEGGTTTATVR